MKIDNIDIKQVYGATILVGSYESLLQYPKLKEPLKNDWAEYDGLEVDLESPVLDKKKVVLNIHCNNENIDALLNFLILKTYRVYHFDDLGLSVKLRFKGISDIQKVQGRSWFKLKLVNDSPLQNYDEQTVNLNAYDTGYLLDGINLKTYGIVSLEGTNLERTNEVKKKLEIKSKFLPGVKVSEQAGKKKAYKATLKLFIHKNTDDFIKGYYKFLHDLSQPNERVLTAYGKEYKFYYQSSKINHFNLRDNDVVCQFDINVNII